MSDLLLDRLLTVTLGVSLAVVALGTVAIAIRVLAQFLWGL